MIPLKDTNPSKTIPFVNYILIAANVICFLFERSLGAYQNDFILRFGLTPASWMIDIHQAPIHAIIPLFTSMFLHGGWMHIVGNMLFLYIFGDNIEDMFGHGKYLLFYLLSGLAAAGTQIYFNSASEAPMVGASGAIAGVLGAYLIMFPKARVTTLIPIIIFIKIVELPAYVFLGIWFVMQMFSGVLALGLGGDAGGVAWWAHIGGFAMGMICVPVFKK